MASLDLESIYKIPAEHRYFNISTKWIPYYPWVIRGFYRLGIRHEVATGLSITSGLAAAGFIASLPESGLFLAAAAAVHLKDVFDATDGALARATGTGHRLGRFVDTIGDGVVFTAWTGACALVMAQAGTPAAIAAAWAAITWVSLFIQCSWFNFYQLHYIERAGASSASKLDERSEPVDESAAFSRPTRMLSALYDAWFGWQDRAIAAWDARERLRLGLPSDSSDPRNDGWYTHRSFMVANSALCFGTHAFVLILALLAKNPQWFLPAVGVAMNLYLGVIAFARRRAFRRAALREVQICRKIG
ncbi:MAG: CDP-alcohol phosphatidyltransferase family protein [Actinomycetota bacterium]